MARSKSRKKRRDSASLNLDQLRHKTADAIARGAFQSAREYARTLCKEEATAEHQRFLVEATIGRAAQMRQGGQLSEAVQMLRTVVEDARQTPELLQRCIREFMLAGDWRNADALTAQLTDADLAPQLEALRVDAAVVHGESGIGQLPTALQPAAQNVLRALVALEQDNDTAAHTAVADIPTTSPLHDWKLLVQGLSAFYAGEATALGLWQQLTPERTPAAIAAPFRAQLEPAFLAAHPQQAALIAFARQSQTEPWLTTLEEVQQALAQDDLQRAMRRAVAAREAIPVAHQELRNRLVRTMYWQVARLGGDEHVDVYARLLGRPSDDPSLRRLYALVNEREGFFADAQEGWASYERELTQHALIRPENLDLARALVWFRMGKLAEQAALAQPAGPAFLFDLEEEEDCAFDAAACFRRSVEIAPHYLPAHEALLEQLQATGKKPPVVRAARQLLKHFPEHQGSLEILADDAFRRNHWDKAVDFQQHAVQARPHDTDLVARLGFYELGLARLRAQQGKFDEARALLTAQLAQKGATDRGHVLCRQAAVELQAGEQQRGEALFEQACETEISRLVAVFRMLIESIRMPLGAAWIKKMDREFRKGLKAKVEGPSAVEMLNTLATFANLDVRYDGLPEHRRLILQYLRRSRQVTFSEAELHRICIDLQAVSPTDKQVLDFANRGSKAFPQQPFFPFLVASYYLTQSPGKCPMPKVHDILHTALDLAQADPAHTALLQPIKKMLDVVHATMYTGPFAGYGNPFRGDDEEPMFGPNLFDALANIFGLPLDNEDDDGWEDLPPPRSKHSGGKSKSRRT